MTGSAGTTSLHAPAGPRASLSGGALLSGILLGAWVVACDGWVKVLARAGCCDSTSVVGDAAAAVWSVPGDCQPLALVAGVELSPATRSGATAMDLALPPALAPWWGAVLFAIALLVSIVILVWRERSAGDALALGTLWAGVAIHGLPRLLAGGSTLTEIAFADMGFSIGDVALAWAGLWLVWRVVLGRSR